MTAEEKLDILINVVNNILIREKSKIGTEEFADIIAIQHNQMDLSLIHSENPAQSIAPKIYELTELQLEEIITKAFNLGDGYGTPGLEATAECNTIYSAFLTETKDRF